MKIFISISRGGTARNILQNRFFELAKENYEKIYIITPAFDDERFTEEFGANNVEFLPMYDSIRGWLVLLFLKMKNYMMFNVNTKRVIMYNYIEDISYFRHLLKSFKYLLVKIIFQPLSKLVFLRKFFRYLDFLFIQGEVVEKYQEYLKKYKPDIVFCTSMMEESDVALIKTSRKEGIKVIAMPKTWDNLSKEYFRAKAEKVLAWAPFMQDQFVKMQDYRAEEINIFGVPQFDTYVDNPVVFSRGEFCRKYGLDESKKIIFFGSEGKIIPTDADIAEIIKEFIDKDKLVDQCQLFVRPHFAYKGEAEKFKNLVGKKNVKVDDFNKPSTFFRDAWDYSHDQINHFTNLMYHSDIIINTCSTLTLDAAANKKPTILINFTGHRKSLPFYNSVERWYVCDYYQKILEFGSARVVNSCEELLAAINSMLRDPDQLVDEQREMCEHFCYKVDGKAGERLFNIIDNYARS